MWGRRGSTVDSVFALHVARSVPGIMFAPNLPGVISAGRARRALSTAGCDPNITPTPWSTTRFPITAHPRGAPHAP